MMTVWTHEVDGYWVVTYTNPTAEMREALRKTSTNRPYLNRFEAGTDTALEIPMRVLVPGDKNTPTVYETIPRTEWVDITRAAQDARDAAAKAERIAARKAARQAAAQALRDAKQANTLGLEPKTDNIIVTGVVATTVNQLAQGGLTGEGEPV